LKIKSVAFAVAACVFPNSASIANPYSENFVKASYYSSGTLTASGERFDQNGFTAASRTLPFGTRLQVTHLETGRSVIVRINDRGPFIRGRELDLAKGAAHALGMIEQGVAVVRIVRLPPAVASAADF
jgi:rare lipoprotein A